MLFIPFIVYIPSPQWSPWSMVCGQFQALRAETERLRAADVAATLLLSEKEEAAANTQNLRWTYQKPVHFTGFRASGCKFGMGNITEDQFKVETAFVLAMAVCARWTSPNALSCLVQARISFFCHFNSVPLVLWEELQYLAEDPSVSRVVVYVGFLQISRTPWIYARTNFCNGHGFKFRVYLYLSIHAWDV